MDQRIEKFAKTLVKFSAEVKKGEVVVIELYEGVPSEMADALVSSVYDVGGYPVVWLKTSALMRRILMNADERAIKLYAAPELSTMKAASAYIGIRAYNNVNEMSDVSEEKMALWKTHWFSAVHIEERVKNTKWVITRWPTPNMAQMAEMSTVAFEDFYYSVCIGVDYEKMSRDMEPLIEWMNKTNGVFIVGPGDTDLAFDIEGIPAVKCSGKRNVPDGEVYTAPIKESVNGVIQFNTPTVYEGKSFSDIRLVFKNGRIVEASCESGDPKALNKILDTDEGSRYVGEFALGLNPQITKPMGDILFDEKIAKSFHFTPGMAYDEAFNGNVSRIHWDLVCIQSGEFGGGRMYFDGELIRDKGIFIPPELQNLNPS